MAANFTPEDGTGLADANSYVAVAYADQYFLDRAVTTWTGDDSAKQSALVRATDYVANRYDGKFIGDRFSETQALHFPTGNQKLVDPVTNLPVPDPMPQKLLKAICEYAVRALTAALAPDPVVDPTGQRVASSTEKVGPIEETTAYQPGGTIYTFIPYPAADVLLRGLVLSSQGRIIRA